MVYLLNMVIFYGYVSHGSSHSRTEGITCVPAEAWLGIYVRPMVWIRKKALFFLVAAGSKKKSRRTSWIHARFITSGGWKPTILMGFLVFLVSNVFHINVFMGPHRALPVLFNECWSTIKKINSHISSHWTTSQHATVEKDHTQKDRTSKSLR